MCVDPQSQRALIAGSARSYTACKLIDVFSSGRRAEKKEKKLSIISIDAEISLGRLPRTVPQVSAEHCGTPMRSGGSAQSGKTAC